MALRAWWRMGGTADASGNGYTLSVSNSPGQTADYFNGSNGASTFNGSSTSPQYYYRTGMTALNVTDNFTMSARIYPTALQATNYFGLQNGIFYKGPATTYNWGMQLTTATGITFCKRTGAEGLQWKHFTGLPDFMNHWTTVTLTITGGYVNLYLDGVYQSQIAVTNIAPGANDSVFVGAAAGGTGSAVTSFTGYIDDVRFYDHVCAQPEITAIHEQGDYGVINFF